MKLLATVRKISEGSYRKLLDGPANVLMLDLGIEAGSITIEGFYDNLLNPKLWKVLVQLFLDKFMACTILMKFISSSNTSSDFYHSSPNLSKNHYKLK